MSNKKRFVSVPFVVSAMQRAIKIPFSPDLESLLLSAQKQSPFKTPSRANSHTPGRNVHPRIRAVYTLFCDFFHLCYTCPNAKSIMSLLEAHVTKIVHFKKKKQSRILETRRLTLYIMYTPNMHKLLPPNTRNRNCKLCTRVFVISYIIC